MCHSCTQAGSGSPPLVCACCACCSRCACCACCRSTSAAMCDGTRGGRAVAMPLWLESPPWRTYADEGRRSLPSDAAPCSLSWIFRRCARGGEAGRWTRRRGAGQRGTARRGAARRRGAGRREARLLLQLLLASRGGVAPQPIEHRQVRALRRLTARLACDRLGHVLARREEAAHLTKPRWAEMGPRWGRDGAGMGPGWQIRGERRGDGTGRGRGREGKGRGGGVGGSSREGGWRASLVRSGG